MTRSGAVDETILVVDKSYTPNKAIADLSDGVTGTSPGLRLTLHYLGIPSSGYAVLAA
jgi:hypothetical protein